jgi:hypothetical protein
MMSRYAMPLPSDFSRPPCCRRLTFYTAALRRGAPFCASAQQIVQCAPQSR